MILRKIGKFEKFRPCFQVAFIVEHPVLAYGVGYLFGNIRFVLVFVDRKRQGTSQPDVSFSALSWPLAIYSTVRSPFNQWEKHFIKVLEKPMWLVKAADSIKRRPSYLKP